MQDRYAADVGDFVKYGLLRRLAPGLRLGVAWYLYPDEGHNEDGKHDAYLGRPDVYRPLDPELFEAMARIRKQRGGVAAVEAAGILDGARFSSQRLESPGPPAERRRWRRGWFTRVIDDLEGCDLVFADPDNGLCADDKFRPGRVKDYKRLPLAEVAELSRGRTAVLYHHNSRFKGGHAAEIDHWLSLLPAGTLALRARGWNARTYFVVHPTAEITERLTAFARDWAPAAVQLHAPEAI